MGELEKLSNSVMGRPRKDIDRSEWDKLKALYSVGANNQMMAAYLGMSKDTFENRMKENPELKSYIEQGRANALATVMKTAYEQAVSGDNPAMTMFYLKTRAGWKETQVVEHSGGVKVDGKTKEEKLAEAKRLLSIIEEDDE